MTPGKQLKPEHRRLQLGPASIYYQVVGAGRPLVLVHGLSGSTRWWTKNIDALADQFRLYLIDLIGFGQSQNGRPFILDEAVPYLKKWMDWVSLERASFIGHSMGGLIAADFASDFPNRVERLVLVDTPGLPFGHGMAREIWGMGQSLRYCPVDFLWVMTADAFQAGLINILRIGRELLTRDIRTKLAQIDRPALIIWGEHDTVVPLALGQKLNSCLANSQFIIIEGAGHVPMWERPGEFNRVVVDFLTAP